MRYVVIILFLILLSHEICGTSSYTYFPQMSNTIAVNEEVGQLQVAGYLSPTVQLCLQQMYDIRSLSPRMKILIVSDEECPGCKDGVYNDTEYMRQYNKTVEQMVEVEDYYNLNDANTNVCPTGFDNADICTKTNIESLDGVTLATDQTEEAYTKNDDTQPFGCYYDTTDNKIYYNLPGSCSGGGHTTEVACIVDGTCGANSVDNANYANKEVECKAATDCGAVASNQQCIWTPSNTWTVDIYCSDDTYLTEATCIADGTCDAATGTGNGGSYTDKAMCEDNKQDCGAPTSILQCVWTATNTWDGSACSNTDFTDEASCLETQGTCDDGAGNVGGGASYPTKTACTHSMADDCGPALSRETCVWTSTNTWTDDSSCDDPTFTDEDACLETVGACAAADSEVGNGGSHTDKTTCNSKSDCGANAATDQCVWSATNTWTAATGTATADTQPVCFGTIPGELGLRNFTTDEIIYESVSHAPTSSIMQDVTYLMPQIVQFVDRSFIGKNMYYIGKCDNCEDYIAPISIVSCPCYNDLLIPNRGDCNDMCPSQVGYQGITNKHYDDNSYLHTNVCTECAPGVYPDCNGQCPTDKGYYNNDFGTCSTPGVCSDTSLLTESECLAADNTWEEYNTEALCFANDPSNTFTFTNHSYVMPDCNNLCPETTCKSEMVTSMSICNTVGQQIPDGRYQNESESCIANDPKTTDRMCQNDCNGLCWWEDGWARENCVIRYHMGYMREDPLYHSNDVYEPPTLTYSESWCPVGQFLSFQKNYINWEETNYKCEVCNRDIFLMHFNTPDSTSGQEHGACCQNMHHKMCGFMMDWYKSSCEEDKLKSGSTRCSNNLFEFSYLSTIQQWTMNEMVVQNLKLRAGYTYIFSRLNTLGNFFANPMRIIKNQDCVGCTFGSVQIDGRDQSVYTSWNSLPTSSITNILGGNDNHDAIEGKPIYWRPSAEGIYYAISTTSRYLMFRIEVSIH